MTLINDAEQKVNVRTTKKHCFSRLADQDESQVVAVIVTAAGKTLCTHNPVCGYD